MHQIRVSPGWGKKQAAQRATQTSGTGAPRRESGQDLESSDEPEPGQLSGTETGVPKKCNLYTHG